MSNEINLYVTPSFKSVYSRLKENKKIVNCLYNIGALITRDDYYELYGFPETVNFNSSSIDEAIEEENEKVWKKLTNLLLDNEEIIESKTANELTNGRFLFEEISDALGFKQELDRSIYKQFYYALKYSFVSNFFQNNWEAFLPNVEVEEMENNPVIKSFVDSLMIEFDRINNIITDSKEFQKFDEIPYEYLNYLSQLLGFEVGTLSLNKSAEQKVRTLAANIIEIYRIRGTAASFELLFNFLGFNIHVVQYYFDRRQKYNYANENKETKTIDKTSYRYYLTENNPADNISEAFPITEIVTDKDFTQPYSFDEFYDYIKKYGEDCVLGYSDSYTFNGILKTTEEVTVVDGVTKKTKVTTELEKILDENKNVIYKGENVLYNGPVYKYFKTNIFELYPSLIEETKENFSAEQLRILSSLLKFLVPEFWKKKYVIGIVGDDGSNFNDTFMINGRKETYKTDKNEDVPKEGFRMFDSEEPYFFEEEKYPFYSVEYGKIVKNESAVSEYRNNNYYLNPEYKDQNNNYGNINWTEIETKFKKEKEALIKEKSKNVFFCCYGGENNYEYIRIHNDTNILTDKEHINLRDEIKYELDEQGNLKKDEKGQVIDNFVELEIIPEEDEDENRAKFWVLKSTIADSDGIKKKYKYVNSVSIDGGKEENYDARQHEEDYLKEAYNKKISSKRIKIIDSTKGYSAFSKTEEIDTKSDVFPYDIKEKREEDIAEYNSLENVVYGFPEDKNDYIINGFWDRKENYYANGLKGNTLKKSLLKNNQSDKIFYCSGKNLDDYIDDKSKELEIKEVKNITWVRQNFVIAKSSINNNKILTINSPIEDEKIEVPILGDLKTFVNKNNVVNFDYIHNCLYCPEDGLKNLEFKSYTRKPQTKLYTVYKLEDIKDDNGVGTGLATLLCTANEEGLYYLEKTKIDDKIVDYYNVYRSCCCEETNDYHYVIENIKNLKSEVTLVPGSKNDFNFSKKNEIIASIETGKSYIYNMAVLTKQTGKKIIFAADGIKDDVIINNSKFPTLQMDPSEYRESKNKEILSIDETFSENYKVEAGCFYYSFEPSKYGRLSKEHLLDTYPKDLSSKSNEDILQELKDRRSSRLYQLKYNFVKGEKFTFDDNDTGEIYEILGDYACCLGGEGSEYSVDYLTKDYIEEIDGIVKNKWEPYDNIITNGINGVVYEIKDGVLKPVNLTEDNYILEKPTLSKMYYDTASKKTVDKLIFGIKKVPYYGNIKADTITEATVDVIPYDVKYHGITEQDDEDNYVLNNYKKEINWSILDGCEIDDCNSFKKIIDEANVKEHVVSGTVKRPTRENTDRIFDYCVDKTTNENNIGNDIDEKRKNTKIVSNILEEIFGNYSFLGANAE